MKKPLVILAIFMVSATLSLPSAGCGIKIPGITAVETTAALQESTGTENTSGETSTSVTAATGTADEAGDEVSDSGTNLPAGWPSAVPVNDKISILLSGSSKTEGKTSWSISGTFSSSGQEIYNYYKEKLSGWSIENDSMLEGENGEKTYNLQLSNASYVFTLIAAETSGEVSVIANVSEK